MGSEVYGVGRDDMKFFSLAFFPRSRDDGQMGHAWWFGLRRGPFNSATAWP